MKEREDAFVCDDSHDLAIIIPTVGRAENLLGCVARIAEHHSNKKIHLVISLNPFDEDEATHTKSLCDMVLGTSPIDVTWVEADRPLGFGGAVNAGVDALLKDQGVPETTIILNDDTLPGPTWLDGIEETFECKTYRESTDPQCKDHNIESFGKIGIVGPVSNYVFQDQRVNVTINSASEIDEFVVDFKDCNQNNYVATNFISGFCMALSRDLFKSLIEQDGFLFDPIYSKLVGGFEDNDLCIRASHLGYGCMVAGHTFVYHGGSKTIGDMGCSNGMRNWATHLKKWESYTQRDQTLAAGFRVKLETANDFLMFKESLRGMANVCDSISVLFTGNPSDVLKSDDFQSLGGMLGAEDNEFINTCSVADADSFSQIGSEWVAGVVGEAWHGGSGVISVQYCGGEFNERDERNTLLSMTHQFSPDWIISVDHDEIFERRVDRGFVERLMKNPNPEVMAYDFSWLNHWNSPEYVRVDEPWGDGGKYTGGTRGWRMYRHHEKSVRKIAAGSKNGLHCGNIPSFSVYVTRVANARFHHFGYMRAFDRIRKYKNYINIDKDHDSALTSAKQTGKLPYQHLVDEVDMIMSPTPTRTGIAFSALVYEGEKPHDLIKVLDLVYGLVDQISLVWTDTAIDKPSDDFDFVGSIYGVDWTMNPLNSDLSECRNAGLDHIKQNKKDEVNWLLTLDLDEDFQDSFKSCCTIRRMAENPRPVAWAFTFVNSLGIINGEDVANESTTNRMIRLDEELDLRWSGKVHESLDKSIIKLHKGGYPATVERAPFRMIHFGLNKSPQEIHDKLEKYGKMLVAELEDDPNQTMPWISLGLHFANDGRDEQATQCFNMAIICDGSQAWMAHKEIGLQHLREAEKSIMQAYHIMSPDDQYRANAVSVLKHLKAIKCDFPYIGLSKNGTFLNSDVVELPNAIPDALAQLKEELANEALGAPDFSASIISAQQEALNK